MGRSHAGGNRRLTGAWGVLVGAAWLTAAGCSSNDSAFSATGSSNRSDEGTLAMGGSGTAIYSPGANAAIGGSTTAAVTKPETQIDVSFEAPQSSLNYVYATNPEQDSVAVIHAATLGIQVVQTGDEPRFLRTIPGKDAALLVDVGASDLAYLETVDGKSTVRYYPDLPSANVIQVAPDGKHAVAYFDINRMTTGKFETLQDVSVMTFAEAGPVVTRMTVGFQPRQLTFAGGTSGAAAAYVVTNDGISILDFGKIDAELKPAIADTIPVFSATEPNGADISVTPDGNYALGRIEGTSKLRLVALANGAGQTLDLAALLPAPVVVNTGTGGAAAGSNGVAGSAGSGSGGAPATGGAPSNVSPPTPAADITDLDISPDGTFALAVSRNRGVLLRVPIPAGFTDTTQVTKLAISDVIVGSAAISPNGRWAVLFTTAVATERRIVIVDLTGVLEPRALDVTKSIKGVAFSSSGDQAYILHNKALGNPMDPGLDPDVVLDRSYGYTLVDLAKAFRKLVVTENEPNLSVTTPDAPYAFLTFQGGSMTVQRLDMESLQVSSIELGSVPISLGIVAAQKRVFVNQTYAEGRMTFIDWVTLEAKTVAGYELNSKIRE